MKESYNQFIDLLYANKEWMFSGIGVTVVCSIIGYVFKPFKKKNKKGSVHQKASFNIGSRITQVNGDLKTSEKNHE